MERGGGYQRPDHPSTTASGVGPGMQPSSLVVVEMNMRPPSESIKKSSSSGSSSSGAVVLSDNECLVREQDRLMPIANVIRIMRKILPPHAKIANDAKETIQECVSEYISFVTSEANDRCQREQRKTVTAEDILWAMSKLGFDDHIEPLMIYLHRYRDFEVRASNTDHVKRPTPDPPVANPFDNAFTTVFHHTGLFGPTIRGNFLNDPPKVLGPSRPPTAVVGFEPYAQCKE